MELFGLRYWLGIILALMPLEAWGKSSAPSACLEQAQALEQSSALLQALTAVPTPPFAPLLVPGEARFVATAALFAELIDVSPRAYIINDIEELRFMPYALARTPLLLVLKEADGWTVDKSRKVIAVARMQNINLSLVWLADSPVPAPLLATLDALNGLIIRSRDLTRLVSERYCLKPQDPAPKSESGLSRN